MIFHISSARFQTTMREHLKYIDHLRTQGIAFRTEINFGSYEDLFAAKEVPFGTYVFTDFERLNRLGLEHAALIAKQLQAAGCRVLNHPLHTLRRYDLLTNLWKQGINSFRPFRLAEDRSDMRFPVFIRHEGEHACLTGLLHNESELAEAIVELSSSRSSSNDLLIIEFCDVQEQGHYQKYGAFAVGGQVIPRHRFASTQWLVKAPKLKSSEALQREREYISNNPHESELQHIFKSAQVEYGRIDYSLLNGKIQVWEINTNPMLTGINKNDPREMVSRHFALALDAAFAKVDYLGDVSQTVLLRQSQGKPMPMKSGRTKEICWWRFRRKLRRAMLNPSWLAVPSTP